MTLTNCNPPVACIKSKKCEKIRNRTIRTHIKPSKPKQLISQKRTYGQPSEQLFSKRWPLSNQNRTTHTREVKRNRNSDTKTGNRQNYLIVVRVSAFVYVNAMHIGHGVQRRMISVDNCFVFFRYYCLLCCCYM